MTATAPEAAPDAAPDRTAVRPRVSREAQADVKSGGTPRGREEAGADDSSEYDVGSEVDTVESGGDEVR